MPLVLVATDSREHGPAIQKTLREFGLGTKDSWVFDDAIPERLRHAIDPSVTLPIDKLNWMQNELVKAGNLKAPFDLTTMTARDIRAEAVRRVTR